MTAYDAHEGCGVAAVADGQAITTRAALSSSRSLPYVLQVLILAVNDG
jgi:hypothetical protein